MREVRRADGKTTRPVWRIPRLLRLSEVQKHQKTGPGRGVTDALVEQFLNYLRAERDASPLTIRNYSADIDYFRAWFNEKHKQVCGWGELDPPFFFCSFCF